MSTSPKTQATTAALPPKKKRERSPAYPAIHLETALSRARTVWEHERKNAAPLDAIMGHWGFKPKSSSGLLAAAAMKKFGLLHEVDGGNARHVRLSELAIKIITDEREPSAEKAALIKQAAMMPAIHKELWKKWRDELPSKPTMRTYLIGERGFTDDAAEQLIDEYQRTISFAGITRDDIIGNQESNDDEDSGETDLNSDPNNSTRNDQKPPPGKGQTTFSISLPGEGTLTIQLPSQISAAAKALIDPWLQAVFGSLTKSPDKE